MKRANIFNIGLLALISVPAIAKADFCDILAGKGAETCRVNVAKSGGLIVRSWLRLKPEVAMQPSTNVKGKFVSGTTPAIHTLGVPHQGRLKLTIDCFAGERTMRIDALPYMLGLTNGANKAFDLTFKIDSKAAFTETWGLDWQHAELKAPKGSQLATQLQQAVKLTVTTQGIVGRRSPVGYVYDVDGFDQLDAFLCI
ncbi:hypothetical protein [Pseudomonas putida]|uniref:hypothetical protein n=1 Tax=Pseudomonas putida TaxID=303 RepID=UPI0011B2856C|nr:hypothetical protein [Pseudomonas putida]